MSARARGAPHDARSTGSSRRRASNVDAGDRARSGSSSSRASTSRRASGCPTSPGGSAGIVEGGFDAARACVEALYEALHLAAARRARLALDYLHPGQGGRDGRGLVRRAPSDAARGQLGRVRARRRDADRAAARADPLRGRDHVSGEPPGHRGRRSTRTSRRARSSTRRTRPAGAELREARVFDVYHGDQVGAGTEVGRDPPRLPVSRPDAHRRGGDRCARGRIVAALAERFGAELRA